MDELNLCTDTDSAAAAIQVDKEKEINKLWTQIYELDYSIAYAKSLMKKGFPDPQYNETDMLTVARNIGTARNGIYEFDATGLAGGDPEKQAMLQQAAHKIRANQDALRIDKLHLKSKLAELNE